MDERISKKQQWNFTDRGRTKYTEKILSQYHFSYHKFHKNCPGIKLGCPQCVAGY
jgi:hypothetical protein